MALEAFLKFEGGTPTVEGSSVKSGHEGEIEVQSYSFGASNAGSRHTATGGGTGRADLSDLSVTFLTDKAAPNLWISCVTGNHFDKITLFLRKAGGTDPVTFTEVQMEDALITAYQTGGSDGSETPMDMIQINYAIVTYIYRTQNADGTPGPDITTSYNLPEGVKS